MDDARTQAVQDYLKTIYALCEQHGRATTGQIAEELGITPASVTGMLKKLASTDPPLLDYRRHYGVMLTPEGEKRALEMIRKHRLIECFLHEQLGYSWDEVHEEAERLEHAVSGELGKRIAGLLQEPDRDPHGAPIPASDLSLPLDCAVPLSQVKAGDDVVVQRVNDDDAGLLRYLAHIGLLPGTSLQVLPTPQFSDHLRIKLEGDEQSITIGERVADEVFVAKTA